MGINTIGRWIEDNRHIFHESDMRYLIKNVKSLDRLNEARDLYQKGVPLAYIIGKEEFFGMEFKVNTDVLIPRCETELIVEKTLEVIKRNNYKNILDLCCGSGNVSVVLKKHLKNNCTVYASDISLKALIVANDNAKCHGQKVDFINCDLLTSFKKCYFDIIIANPPYVAPEDIKGSVKYEPRGALEAENKGFCFIKRIIKEAHLYLNNKGSLIIEIGYNHKEALERLIEASGAYTLVEWVKDYSGHYRGAVLKKWIN
ncbi:MAG: peptide chain release factor N(5)-glutamine methyltransferase [Candidatus Omnitrophota bacterium]